MWRGGWGVGDGGKQKGEMKWKATERRKQKKEGKRLN